ncbi:hypothetical protein QBC38DRAFT_270456 [Podospora fimiseda]|uniref:Protein kinase domain-containing protein n=1 Tax=Podospora fimiseda TaxID=252190 RepID=A0AAN7BL29_9PEZI|nr:hypothetical protein QBC38DRAFT_270456 [Podospora fimiseda]
MISGIDDIRSSQRICQDSVLKLLQGNEGGGGGGLRFITSRAGVKTSFLVEDISGDSHADRLLMAQSIDSATPFTCQQVQIFMEGLARSSVGGSTGIELGRLYPLGERPRDTQTIGSQDATGLSLVERLNLVKFTTTNSGLGRGFFPLGVVEELVTAQTVMEELRALRHINDQLSQYAQHVCGDGRKSICRIFAILCLLHQPQEIIYFVDEGISDADLPLTITNASLELQHPRNDKSLVLSNTFDHEQFEDLQWTMIPASFSKGTQYCRFDKRQSLPWSEELFFNEQFKSYAYISRVRIHDGYHAFQHPFLINGMLCLQTFTSYHDDSRLNLDSETNDTQLPKIMETRRHFDRVLKSHEMATNLNHPHLTPLLAAYEHGDQNCLLLPWAEANLVRIFNHTTAGNPLGRESLLWLTGQLRGLADALRLLHAFKAPSDDDTANYTHGHISGYHILGFRHPDRVDMANATRFTLAWSGFGSGTPSSCYQPPECNTEGYIISASYDVWAFGCLMLETVAWFLGGGEYVGKFLHSRKKADVLMGGVLSTEFYEYVRDHKDDGSGRVYARVKTGVHDFAHRLRAEPVCSKFIHRILDLVMQKMLVVESSGLRLRASSIEVFKELESIHLEATCCPLVVDAMPVSHKQRVQIEAVELHLNQTSIQVLRRRFNQLEPHYGQFIRRTGFEELVREKYWKRAGELVQQPDMSIQLSTRQVQKCNFKSERNSTRRPRFRQPQKRQPKNLSQISPQSDLSIPSQGNWSIALQALSHMVYLIIILSLVLQPRLFSYTQSSQCI